MVRVSDTMAKRLAIRGLARSISMLISSLPAAAMVEVIAVCITPVVKISIITTYYALGGSMKPSRVMAYLLTCSKKELYTQTT